MRIVIPVVIFAIFVLIVFVWLAVAFFDIVRWNSYSLGNSCDFVKMFMQTL